MPQTEFTVGLHEVKTSPLRTRRHTCARSKLQWP